LSQGRNTLILATGHFVNDMYSSVVPPLLPLITSLYGLSYALAGLVVASYHIVSSVTQPVFGYMFDRFNYGGLIMLGILLGSAGIALLGYSNSYASVLIAVIIAGIGSAIFHPIALSIASTISRERWGTFFSLFILGGNIGLAAGPAIVLIVVANLGIQGLPILVIPALLSVSLLIKTRVSWRPARDEAERRKTDEALGVKNSLTPVSALLSSAIIRSIAGFGLIAFIPLYVTSSGLGIEAGGLLLFMMLSAGAAGTLVAGLLADLLGTKKVAISQLAIAAPLILILPSIKSFSILMLLVAVLGLSLISAQTVLMLISYELLPYNKGLASSLVHGVAFGVANTLVPLVGAVIDLFGFSAAFYLLASLQPIAALLVLVAKRGQPRI